MISTDLTPKERKAAAKGRQLVMQAVVHPDSFQFISIDDPNRDEVTRIVTLLSLEVENAFVLFEGSQ